MSGCIGYENKQGKRDYDALDANRPRKDVETKQVIVTRVRLFCSAYHPNLSAGEKPHITVPTAYMVCTPEHTSPYMEHKQRMIGSNQLKRTEAVTPIRTNDPCI